MKRLTAVADGLPDGGLGHLVRSSAVVLALRARGVDVSCCVHGRVEDVVVDGVLWLAERPVENRPMLVDSYTLDPEAVTVPCAWFDDGRSVPAGAELLISPAMPDDGGDPRRLHGYGWSCLRPCFWGAPRAEVRKTVQRVLVASGGGDPGAAGHRLAIAARNAVPRAEVRLVVGPQSTARPPAGVTAVVAPPNLAEELRAADLMICLAGQTALEAACMGVPAVIVAAVENQRVNASRLASTGAAATGTLDGSIVETIATIAQDRSLRDAMSAAGQATVDGFGALRVAAEIERRILVG